MEHNNAQGLLDFKFKKNHPTNLCSISYDSACQVNYTLGGDGGMISLPFRSKTRIEPPSNFMTPPSGTLRPEKGLSASSPR
jgi:hypothetical protein